jgi:hypothetical protein
LELQPRNRSGPVTTYEMAHQIHAAAANACLEVVPLASVLTGHIDGQRATPPKPPLSGGFVRRFTYQ